MEAPAYYVENKAGNTLDQYFKTNRRSALSVPMRSLLIGGGVAIYPKGWNAEEVLQACHESAPYHLGDCSFFWAFYLSAIGGGLTILLSSFSCHAYQRKVNRRLEIDDL